MKTIQLNPADVTTEKVTTGETNEVSTFTYLDITCFNDASKYLDVEIVQSSDDIVAYQELKIIVKAINNVDNFPDWGNIWQAKWHPVFKAHPVFEFIDSVKHDSPNVTTVGSHLVYESKEKSDYAAKQFIEHYKSLLT